jgi:broad specificity phosphatase PhoE
MPTVLLIRHAQASFGSADYDVLSALGRRQAAVLAETLARRDLDWGPLASGSGRRHLETAAALPLGARQAPDPRWNEYDSESILRSHGDEATRLNPGAGEEQLGWREFQARLDRALDAWTATPDGAGFDRAWSEFRDDAVAALADLAGSTERGETAVAVSSGGVIAALCCALIGLPDGAFTELSRVAINTAITKIACGPRRSTVVSFNEHQHLEGAGRELVTYR